ncbi:MAG TPA: hypothetical protein VJ672_12275 [Gemmatimonadaceae bacterium]|nr:hypothetical protein [Gemmatimonadaceae bacterium]
MKPAYRRAITLLLVGMFGLITIADAIEVVKALLDIEREPPLLNVMQSINLLLAAATAVGAWKMKRWSALTALGYGITTSAMIVSLGPMFSLPTEERSGLLTGAAAVLGIALLSAWHLRRVTTPDVAARQP